MEVRESGRKKLRVSGIGMGLFFDLNLRRRNEDY